MSVKVNPQEIFEAARKLEKRNNYRDYQEQKPGIKDAPGKKDFVEHRYYHNPRLNIGSIPSPFITINIKTEVYCNLYTIDCIKEVTDMSPSECGTYYKVGENFGLSDLQTNQAFIAEIITDTIEHINSVTEQRVPETYSQIHRYLYKDGKLYPAFMEKTSDGEYDRPYYSFGSSPVDDKESLDIIGNKLLDILMSNQEENIDELSNPAVRRK